MGDSGAHCDDRVAGRGAGRASLRRGDGNDRQRTPASSKIASRNPAHVHSPSAARCQIPRSRPIRPSMAEARWARRWGEPRGPRRHAPRLAPRPAGASSAGSSSSRAKEPGRTDDPRILSRRRLSVQLRAAVGRLRVRSVRLDVGLPLPSVEDIVGREVDDWCAERGDVRGATDVDRRSSPGILLSSVDIGPRRRVERQVCGRRAPRAPEGSRPNPRSRARPRRRPRAPNGARSRAGLRRS